ncbi:TPA: type III secretion system chaperone YscB [Yersinia enterocolitica]
MQNLLKNLATSLGRKPFVADKQGVYRLTIDKYLVMLAPHGSELVLRTPIDAPMLREGNNVNVTLLRSLMQQALAWAKRYPQTLVLDDFGQLVLEARLRLQELDTHGLQEVINKQLALLEHLIPQLTPFSVASRVGWN